MATIVTDNKTLALLRLYCIVNRIRLKDIIKILAARDRQLKAFAEKVRTLR